MKKRVLYLHGLESSNVCDKVDFLRERVDLLAPSIDYNKSNNGEDHLIAPSSSSNIVEDSILN